MPQTVFDRPRVWLFAIGIATLPFAAALPRLQLRTDGGALYPSHNAVVESTAADRKLFRDPEAAIVLVSARTGGAGIFTPEGLRYVAALTDRVRRAPGVRGEDVISLSTVPDVSSSMGTLQLTRFTATTVAEADAVRRRLDAQEIYSGLLYGRDGRSTAVYVPIAEGASRTVVVKRLGETLRQSGSPQFEARLTGPVVAEVLLGENILTDLTHLLPLVILVIIAALFLCLRSVAGVAIPMIEIGCVMAWTFGLMAMLGVPLTLVTSILPVLLMAMAITDQIHVIERLQSLMGSGLPRRRALEQTYREVGLPIARTALTTALGFLSFTTTSVPAMRHFGLFACLGLMLSMLFSFTLIPATLALIPDRWLRNARGEDHPPRGVEGWAAKHSVAAALLAAALFVVALAGLPRLKVQDSWVSNFHPRSDLAVTEREFNRNYSGSYRLDVTLESDVQGFFRQARGLRLVDSLATRLAHDPDVGGVQSFADIARVGLRGVDPARRLESLDDGGVAQLLLLLDMSGSASQLDRLVTPAGDVARIRCSVRSANYTRASGLIARVESLTRGLADAGIRPRVNGDLAVATQVVQATVSNQVRSIAATVLALLLFLSLSYASVSTAAILLLPVVMTSLMVFGGMGLFAVPLGVATSMFAALAEGEGVNYTIHIVSRYLDSRRTREAPDALRETLERVGPAVRWNGVALISGCLMLCFSSLAPVRSLGALLAVGMTLSYLLAFMVLPVLLLRRGAPASRSRRGRAAATAVLLLALASLGLGTTNAGAGDAGPPRDDPRARRLVTEIERAQRAGNRLIGLDIDLAIAGRPTVPRRMLALARGDRAVTHLLYVYAWPRVLRGSTLVIEDSVVTTATDHMWLSFPRLDTYREVQATALRVMIPGTGLSYEDARGWVTPERFDFVFERGAPGIVNLTARPKNDSLETITGSSRLSIEVDAAKRAVRKIEFFDASGRPYKTYEATRFISLGGYWYATQVRTTNTDQLTEATITYRYRALAAPPPIELFRNTAKGPPFMERLIEWRDRLGFQTAFPDTIADDAGGEPPR